MVSTVDGQTTFLTGTDGHTVVGTGPSPTPGRRQRRSRNELRQLDEKELIFELVGLRVYPRCTNQFNLPRL